MSDTDKHTLIDLYEILIIKNLKRFLKSFRCWKKADTCFQNLQIDFVAVL